MVDIKHNFADLFSFPYEKVTNQNIFMNSKTKFGTSVANISNGVTLKTYQGTKVLFKS